MGELSLDWLTVAQAAARRGVSTRTVERWVRAGLAHAVLGAGRTRRYLLRPADVDSFTPRSVGAPAGNANAKKKSDAKTPRNSSTPKKSRKKSRNP